MKIANTFFPKTYLTSTVKTKVSPTVFGSSHSNKTLQLDGCKYFPVTYCSNEGLALGKNRGWAMMANVISPATQKDIIASDPKNFYLFNVNFIKI